MRAFLDARQGAHDPQMFMANGMRLPNPETPERIAVLKAGAEAAGAGGGAGRRPATNRGRCTSATGRASVRGPGVSWWPRRSSSCGACAAGGCQVPPRVVEPGPSHSQASAASSSRQAKARSVGSFFKAAP